MGHKTARITERREVDIDTSGPALEYRPRLYTASGRCPIGVSRVQLSYRLPGGELTSVTTMGDLIDPRDIERRRQMRAGPTKLTRRVPIDWRTYQPEHDVPEWLEALIEKYRPGPRYLVTFKGRRNPEHNPRAKQTGACPVSTQCTDVTGEHHTLLVVGDAALEAALEAYSPVTRVELVMEGNGS